MEVVELHNHHNLKEYKRIDEILEEKADMKTLLDTHDKFSLLLEKFMAKATK